MRGTRRRSQPPVLLSPNHLLSDYLPDRNDAKAAIVARKVYAKLKPIGPCRTGVWQGTNSYAGSSSGKSLNILHRSVGLHMLRATAVAQPQLLDFSRFAKTLRFNLHTPWSTLGAIQPKPARFLSGEQD